MRRHRKFRIRLEDESRLETLADFSLSRPKLWLAAFAALTLAVVLGGLLVAVTPLRELLPGYMKQSERAATEDNILRLDSILNAYSRNQNYIDNILRVTDTSRSPSDSVPAPANLRELSPDSLLPASGLEHKFVSAMEEREKFNISVLAPLAADGMIFSPVSQSGVFTEASRREQRGVVVLADSEAPQAVADGSVVATYYSPADHGYVMIMQHARGFLSRYSRLGNPLASPGDLLTAGQIVSLPPAADAKGVRKVELMMWHNGLPLVPYDYIGTQETSVIKEAPYEAPRGR